MAHCDLAAGFAGAGSVPDAYEELLMATTALSKFRAPSLDLRLDVAEALQGMAPEYVSACAALPLDDPARRGGSEVLGRLIWGRELAPDAACPRADRARLLSSVAGKLTAAEVVEAQSLAPKGAQGAEDAYDHALALLGTALSEARPDLVPEARKLLIAVAASDVGAGRALPEPPRFTGGNDGWGDEADGVRSRNPLVRVAATSARAAARMAEGAGRALERASDALPVWAGGRGGGRGGRRDTVLVELAVCDLLVGRSESALAWLGLADPSDATQSTIASRARPDANVVAFVRSQSGASADRLGDDLMGCCVLVERWVNDALVPAYPELSGASFQLMDWFEDPAVADGLALLERKGLGRLIGSVPGLGGLVRAASGAGAAAAGAAVGAAGAAGAVVLAPVTGAAGLVAAGVRAARELLPGHFRGANDELAEARRRRGMGLRRRAAGALDGGERADEDDWGYSDGAGDSRGDDFDARARGGDDAWGSVAPQAFFSGGGRVGRRARRTVAEPGAAVRLVAALAVAAAAYLGLARGRLAPAPDALLHFVDGPLLSLPARVTVRETGRPARVPPEAASAEMTTRVAERLVRHWQEVKASALGPAHEVGRLNEILDGRMLQQWRTRALDVKSHGWHWAYSVGSLTIDAVDVSADGQRAVVEATQDEAARMVERGQAVDHYRSTYTAQYQLVRKNGLWKIVGGKICYRGG